MKKTLIASAVAATFSSGAFAMDNSKAEKILGMIEGMPQVYGDIEMYGTYTDIDGVADNTDGIVDDVDSTIGFKHSTQVSEDLTITAEAAFSYDSADASEGLSSDSATLTFDGGFGSITIGGPDAVYEAIDIIDYSENLSVLAAGDLLTSGGIGSNAQLFNYTSPSIGGNMNIHATVETNEDSDNTANLALTYAQDNVTFNLGYAMNDAADDIIGLSGSFGVSDDFTISAQYETLPDVVSFMGVLGTYTMGANTFNFAYMISSPDADGADDTSAFSGNVVHSLSENIYVYAEAGFQADPDVTNFVVGTAYSF